MSAPPLPSSSLASPLPVMVSAAVVPMMFSTVAPTLSCSPAAPSLARLSPAVTVMPCWRPSYVSVSLPASPLKTSPSTTPGPGERREARRDRRHRRVGVVLRQVVVAGPAVDRVDAVTARDVVIAGTAVDDVISVTAVDDVVAGAAVEAGRDRDEPAAQPESLPAPPSIVSSPASP